MTSKKKTTSNEDNLKNEDYLKNEDNLKNENNNKRILSEFFFDDFSPQQPQDN